MQHIMIIGAGSIGTFLVRELHRMYPEARLSCIDSVRYTSRKLPLAWRGTHAEKLCRLDSMCEATEFLRTEARRAATLFPPNANVAATIAFAGVGFKRTEVSLNADPAAQANTHLIEVGGAFGAMRIEMRNKPFPDNPKTSMLAGLSLLRVIRNRSEAVQI
jgi:aspartate dehydrogenase